MLTDSSLIKLPKDRLIVALDVPTAKLARDLVNELKDSVGAFKIGLQLFTAAGPAFVKELADSGSRVFLDLKFHDIPNTVAMACIEAARLGVWMMNVHAIGGSEMMTTAYRAVQETCLAENIKMPKVIAVTVLTSSDESTLKETGIESTVDVQVTKLAQLASNSGLDGVVASPWEVEELRTSIERQDFTIVTPGIRSSSATINDQRRVMSFAGALAAGADFMVVGRPITGADDKVAAVENVIASI